MLPWPEAMTALFDALFWIAWVIVYGVAAAAGLAAGDLVWGPALWQRAAAVVAGYVAFLHAFPLAVGGLRFVAQPRLTEGVTPIGLNRRYVAWGIQSIFQGLFTTSFFASQVHILFYLHWIYYRLMGMKIAPSTLIGTRVIIRQAELVELGEGAILGEDSLLVPHLSPDGKSHIMRAIRVGARAVIGSRAMIGPGVSVGAGSVVGAGSILTLDVKVGAGAKIGPGALLLPGVTVEDNARVPAGAVLKGEPS